METEAGPFIWRFAWWVGNIWEMGQWVMSWSSVNLVGYECQASQPFPALFVRPLLFLPLGGGFDKLANFVLCRVPQLHQGLC